DEMGEDYAKLAGLTAEEDLNEKTRESMRKRLPWLVVLLVLGLAISSVVGVFEAVVAVLPVIVSFQSLILDMAGNVGTQSLAVTIRVLMDENLAMSQKIELAFKEVRVGLCNGLVLGIVTFLALGLYLHVLKGGTWSYAFLIAGCVSAALLASMIISSLVGTVVPMIFHSLKVDPAVASGPLITTVNDLVAILTYYGLAWVLLINVCHLR
ncbi:MAG: magnesium transporter, partial [Lachnospiraceae bacterium]|nr:magnesium transporter [Lachnospiraceae bacterium]